jgi:transposase
MWGKKEQPTLWLMDSQATKNTDCASETWFCIYKCTNWIKRHLLVDVLWFPIWVHVTTANISDKQWWKELVKKYQDQVSKLKAILLDNGYNGKWFKISIGKLCHGNVKVQITPKPKGWKWFKVVHKRRVVERSNAWMEKCRRLHKNNERLIETSEAMIKLCFIRLMARRLA